MALRPLWDGTRGGAVPNAGLLRVRTVVLRRLHPNWKLAGLSQLCSALCGSPQRGGPHLVPPESQDAHQVTVRRGLAHRQPQPRPECHPRCDASRRIQPWEGLDALRVHQGGHLVTSGWVRANQAH